MASTRGPLVATQDVRVRPVACGLRQLQRKEDIHIINGSDLTEFGWCSEGGCSP